MEKLKRFVVESWQPFVSAGSHECELCQYAPALSQNNLFIPHAGKIYVAPEGIVHYISQHWNKPLDVFLDAVHACPDMGSMEYKKLILENGGRELVKYYSKNP